MPEMVEFSKIGTLYLNGKPQKVGVAYNGEQISFGPAERGKGIQWIKSGQLLIADRCVCTDISWTQLDEQGLVFGTIVQISGKYYLCRCPKVGVEGGRRPTSGILRYGPWGLTTPSGTGRGCGFGARNTRRSFLAVACCAVTPPLRTSDIMRSSSKCRMLVGGLCWNTWAMLQTTHTIWSTKISGCTGPVE